jgi:hypothetical protein
VAPSGFGGNALYAVFAPGQMVASLIADPSQAAQSSIVESSEIFPEHSWTVQNLHTRSDKANNAAIQCRLSCAPPSTMSHPHIMKFFQFHR